MILKIGPYCCPPVRQVCSLHFASPIATPRQNDRRYHCNSEGRDGAKRKVKKDILQIILNAHNKKPELYMEQRVRDEMNMFIYGALVP